MTEPIKKFAFEDTPEFWKGLGKRVVKGVRPRKGRNCPRWVAVMDLTSHGSTYSIDLCRYFGLDPDEVVSR